MWEMQIRSVIFKWGKKKIFSHYKDFHEITGCPVWFQHWFWISTKKCLWTNWHILTHPSFLLCWFSLLSLSGWYRAVLHRNLLFWVWNKDPSARFRLPQELLPEKWMERHGLRGGAHRVSGRHMHTPTYVPDVHYLHWIADTKWSDSDVFHPLLCSTRSGQNEVVCHVV